MTRLPLHLVLVAMLSSVLPAPVSAQQDASEVRRELIRAAVRGDIPPDERRAYARRPGIDSALICLMQDNAAPVRARFEAAQVLAHVQTARADSFIRESVELANLHPGILTILMLEIAPRPDGFGIRLIEDALASGPYWSKLAAISATRTLSSGEAQRLLTEATSDPDPSIANAAQERLEDELGLRPPPRRVRAE